MANEVAEFQTGGATGGFYEIIGNSQTISETVVSVAAVQGIMDTMWGSGNTLVEEVAFSTYHITFQGTLANTNVGDMSIGTDVTDGAGLVLFTVTQGGGSVPTDPGDFTALNETTTTIDLTWSDSTDEDGYKVYQKLTGEPDENYVEIGDVGPNSDTFNVTGLTPDTSYTFKVVAYNATGDCENPPTVVASTLADTPEEAPATLGSGGGFGQLSHGSGFH